MENPSSKDVTFKCQVPGKFPGTFYGPEMISPYKSPPKEQVKILINKHGGQNHLKPFCSHQHRRQIANIWVSCAGPQCATLKKRWYGHPTIIRN